MIFRIVIFLALNFGALAIGGRFTGNGVSSDWYQALDKAPWTPPGWVFGAAWTSLMICFAVYMSYLWPAVENKKMIIGLFLLQWILNVAWNPLFFYFHQVAISLMVIVSLTMLIGYFLFQYWEALAFTSLLILPYLVWMFIATSLNAYIYLNN
jgi:benzodiazapine receptor